MGRCAWAWTQLVFAAGTWSMLAASLPCQNTRSCERLLAVGRVFLSVPTYLHTYLLICLDLLCVDSASEPPLRSRVTSIDGIELGVCKYEKSPLAKGEGGAK